MNKLKTQHLVNKQSFTLESVLLTNIRPIKEFDLIDLNKLTVKSLEIFG